MQNALPRFAPLLLLMLCLSGCGQTGRLFMRMPPVTFPPLAPRIPAPEFEPMVVLPGETTSAPASATAPVPAAATHLAPAASTRQ